MKKIKKFINTTVLGGIAVVLPVAILVFIFKWLFTVVSNILHPVTRIFAPVMHYHAFFANMLVIAVIFLLCFIVGFLVRTRLGAYLYRTIEKNLLARIPGYTLVKETVIQFTGSKKSPFSQVALAQIYENDTLATCFITDRHENGMYTVFVPTGPNPTSGNIFHLKKKYVHPIDVSVEETMRSIISCGAGSTKLVEKCR